MKKYSSLLSGVIVALLTFAYWLFIMTIGDTFRMEHNEYRSEITFGFVISAIIVNLVLVYMFFSRSQVKNAQTLLFISLPYILLLIAVEITSQFLPRALDIVFIIGGCYLIFELSKRKLESYKPIVIFSSYLILVTLSYTFLFGLIETVVN